MSKDKQGKGDDDGGNMLSILMSQAGELDFSDPNAPENKDQDPSRLLVEGFE